MTDLPPSYDTIRQSRAPGSVDLPTYNATWASASQSPTHRSPSSSGSPARTRTASSSNRPNTLPRPRPRDDRPDAPDASAPITYPVGKARTQPLVFVSEVRGHLALLRAFAALRAQIDAYDPSTEFAPPFMPDDQDRRWAWFVGLAVERFAVWCETLTDQDAERAAEDFLPPLDVLMVWHTYMLNPGWYAEDRIRDPVLSHLTQVGPIFSSALSFQLEHILASEPTAARTHSWVARTTRALDPLEDAHLHPTKEIRCPKCGGVIEVAYMDTTRTGYLQQNFFTRCTAPSCRGVPRITKAVLGARKLAEDLARQKYLAGTLRTPAEAADRARGKQVRKLVLAHPRFARPPPPRTGWTAEEEAAEAWVVSILEKNDYELERMRSAMAAQIAGKGGNLIRRILSAYTNGERVSIDLVGAVIRQGAFIKKMQELRWTHPDFFESDPDRAHLVLRHAIARYHGFLDLLAASPKSVFVPTLDIDLVWHTHQLMGPEYNADCMDHVGRYIDHDDKVEEDALANVFDATCRAWKDRFNVPYTHCSCPHPGSSASSDSNATKPAPKPKPKSKLSLLRSALHASKPPRTETKTLSAPHLDLDLDLPFGADPGATHPSDHNAVFLFHRKNAGLEARARRLERVWKLNAAKEGEHGHDPAFLVPVPEYWTYPLDVVCAATPGGVVNNPGGGCGECVGGGGACAVEERTSTAGALCWGGSCQAGRYGRVQ
ncbi:putative glycine-rich domain-containing protein-like [Lyophyllum shimeji]|uniref:Glycine-rich domain-containing protein-like n=1 Tax=Lyophyllum shimeji TaxID=47721 RepID=A0A9P3PE58_LYOSH|nr:putative glycine-rich domain-containing protein-like [Lyophyllum shimeji]